MLSILDSAFSQNTVTNIRQKYFIEINSFHLDNVPNS